MNVPVMVILNRNRNRVRYYESLHAQCLHGFDGCVAVGRQARASNHLSTRRFLRAGEQHWKAQSGSHCRFMCQITTARTSIGVRFGQKCSSP